MWKALQTYGNSVLTEEQVSEIIDTLDPEGTGKINYKKFIDAMVDWRNINLLLFFSCGQQRISF